MFRKCGYESDDDIASERTLSNNCFLHLNFDSAIYQEHVLCGEESYSCEFSSQVSEPGFSIDTCVSKNLWLHLNACQDK